MNILIFLLSTCVRLLWQQVLQIRYHRWKVMSFFLSCLGILLLHRTINKFFSAIHYGPLWIASRSMYVNHIIFSDNSVIFSILTCVTFWLFSWQQSIPVHKLHDLLRLHMQISCLFRRPYSRLLLDYSRSYF